MISKKTAQQIVDTVKDVCGFNINFINEQGIVLASTDPARIGTVHEGGRQVIAKGEPLEVEQDGLFPGTHKGVNIPIFRGGTLTAVIGISGEPAKVRIYAHLAERITLLILREQEMNAAAHTLAEKKSYLLNLLTENGTDVPEEIIRELENFHINTVSSKRMIAFKLYCHGRESLSVPEASASRFLEELPGCLYSYEYPASFRALADSRNLGIILEKLEYFNKMHSFSLKAGIGSSVPLSELSRSWTEANIALRALKYTDTDSVLFDRLSLEVLLSGISEENGEAFCRKTLASLSSDDLALLRAYFENDQSLSETCRKLFLHKNTLQYRLNRIHRLCGLNPRSFRDAAVLYLALRIKDC